MADAAGERRSQLSSAVNRLARPPRVARVARPGRRVTVGQDGVPRSRGVGWIVAGGNPVFQSLDCLSGSPSTPSIVKVRPQAPPGPLAQMVRARG